MMAGPEGHQGDTRYIGGCLNEVEPLRDELLSANRLIIIRQCVGQAKRCYTPKLPGVVLSALQLIMFGPGT
jgi:hypothetical protein